MKEAKQLYMQGDSKGALEIIDSVLILSPKNTDALQLKSAIYDAWGRFDDSLQLLQKVANHSQIDDEESTHNLNRRLDEDRDSLIYSKLTEDGRWYFSFSPLQIFIAVFGLVGCILFLISSPLYFQKEDSFLFLGLSFFILVLFPWMVLFILHFQGVKKVLVGLYGVAVYHGFTKNFVKWDEIGSATIEYDTDLNTNYLHLFLNSKKTNEILFDFNISHKKSDVFARRHFVKNLLGYVDHVNYTARGHVEPLVQTETQSEIQAEVQTAGTNNAVE